MTPVDRGRRPVVCAAIFAALGASAPADAGRVEQVPSLHDIRVESTASHVTLRLVATTGISGTVQRLEGPPRLFVDLAGIVPRVPRTIAVGRGAVRQVRVALNRASPAVTRLVVDLNARGAYQLNRGPTGRELTLTVSTSSPRAAAGGATYATWFEETAAHLARLLQRTSARVGPSQPIPTLTQLQDEWAAVAQDIQSTTPSPPLHGEHELLLAAARLGQVAAGRRIEAARLTSEAAAGEAGATMLLNRARADLARAAYRTGATAR